MNQQRLWRYIRHFIAGVCLTLTGIPTFAGGGITPGAWTSVGPDHLGGRISTIAIHPTQTNKMWVGSPGGGIWKSTDSGASWSLVNDFLPSLVITSIVIDPGNANVMYAGTGERIPSNHTRWQRDPIAGSGLLKSVDGGMTWAALPSTSPSGNSEWAHVHKLAIHPTNSNVLLAATFSAVWRSADAGSSWTKVLSQSNQEVQFDPLDGNKALTSGRRAWYSTNAGLTWTESTGFTHGDKISSAIAYSRQAGVVYAVSDDSFSSFSGRYAMRSDNGGVTWVLLPNAPTSMVQQADLYANSVWVDPADSNHVIIGSKDLYRSTNAGASWTQISASTQPGSVPVGQHVILSSPAYNGTSNRTIFFGTHGGLYRAADIQAVTATDVGWSSLNNGLSIAQFYSGAGHAANNGRIIGGTQGSGLVVYSGSGVTWSSFAGSEGGDTAIDPTDGNYIYGGAPRVRVHRSTTGGAPSTDIAAGIDFPIGNVAAPTLLDPNNPNAMLVGGASLWRSTNVRAAVPGWTNIKFGFHEPDFEWTCRASAIAIVPGNSDVIWLGKNGTRFECSANLLKTTNGTAGTPTWSEMGVGTLPQGTVRALLIDKDNTNRVYVAVGDEVWRTPDGGSSWTQITGRLRAKNVRTLVRHPTAAQFIYAGTDAGIWVSDNGGDSWLAPNEAPANVRVDELFWIGNTLYAATHGRGMFRATVTLPTFALTITKAGAGSGPVTSSPGGIVCGSTCSATFAQGTLVTLTATANPGSTFAGWSGACSGTASTCTVAISAATNVTATFNPGSTQTLTVFKSGTGSGPVTSSPSGIACGSDCTQSYAGGTSVTLTATPNSGSVFAGWSGACTGTASTCVVAMTAAREVTATFNKSGYLLTVTKAGTGSGPVTSSPAGIVCGSDCTQTYGAGTSVTLTATANSGSVFAGWSGACAGTGSTCVVTMDAAKTATATFNKTGFALTVAKTGSGSGSGLVTSNPPGINCGGVCSAGFAAGTSVTLTASINTVSQITWSGACSGSSIANSSTCVVPMTAAKSVTVSFAIVRPLTVSKAGTGSGLVASSPAGISCGSACYAYFFLGDIVALTATPDARSTFIGWNGHCSGTATTCVLTMDASKSVSATFLSYPLTVAKAGDGSGTVVSNPAGVDCGSVCSNYFGGGTTVTLTATPAAGSAFTGWSGSCGSSTNCAVSMGGPRNLTATFSVTPVFPAAR